MVCGAGELIWAKQCEMLSPVTVGHNAPFRGFAGSLQKWFVIVIPFGDKGGIRVAHPPHWGCGVTQYWLSKRQKKKLSCIER